ncbi:MAG: regulatory protein RecX [Candidatus Puniceispirillaceae bacterium]
MPSEARIKKRLNNKALHYLGRYASTTARLRQVLQKFAKRKLETAEPEDIEEAIEAVIADCQKFGYIDDRNFIDSRIRAGRNAGRSERQITQKLLQAGIDREMAQASLNAHREGYARAEWLAALVHIRKKRLGCYGKGHKLSPEAYQKQMARLARAGFGLDIIKQILSIDSIEEAENLEAEYRQNMPL